MVFKIFIIIALFAIVASLGSGLFFLVNDKGQTNRTLKALTVRIGLSLGLFILLMIAYAFGFITPHGVHPAAL